MAQQLREPAGWNGISDLVSQWSQCAQEADEFAREQLAELQEIADRLGGESGVTARLVAWNKEHDARLGAAQAGVRENDAKVQGLEERIAELSAEVQAASTAAGANEDLLNENRRLAEENQALCDEASSLRIAAAKAKEELLELAAMKSALETSRLELDAAKATVARQKAELSNAAYGSKSSHEQIDELEQEITDLRAELEETRGRLSRYKEQMTAEREEWHAELKLLKKAIEMKGDEVTATSESRKPGGRTPAGGGKPSGSESAKDRVVDRLAQQFKRLQVGPAEKSPKGTEPRE